MLAGGEDELCSILYALSSLPAPHSTQSSGALGRFTGFVPVVTIQGAGHTLELTQAILAGSPAQHGPQRGRTLLFLPQHLPAAPSVSEV